MSPCSSGVRLWPVSWSRDGRALFFNGASPQATVTDTDLYWMDLINDSTAQALTEGPTRDENPKISPSGEWVAYASDRSTVDEIYVATWPGWERHIRVSLTGGREPLWSRDGSELFFLSGNRIMAVDASRGFPAPDPVELFREHEPGHLVRGTTPTPQAIESRASQRWTCSLISSKNSASHCRSMVFSSTSAPVMRNRGAKVATSRSPPARHTVTHVPQPKSNMR